MTRYTDIIDRDALDGLKTLFGQGLTTQGQPRSAPMTTPSSSKAGNGNGKLTSNGGRLVASARFKVVALVRVFSHVGNWRA